MKFTAEAYDFKYSAEIQHDDLTLDAVVAMLVCPLLVNLGFGKESIAELFADGYPGDWDDVWTEWAKDSK